MNRFHSLSLCAFLPMTMASASATESPPRVDIILANFSSAPADIQLAANMPVTLVFTNKGWEDHVFSAREFFRSATMDIGMCERVGKKGKLGFFVGQSRYITLTPKAGVYRVGCSQFLHADRGWQGR